MRIKNLDIGVERITQWNVGDEVHLPNEAGPAPAFLPQHRPLDEILRRPSLDERLPELLLPSQLDPGLLEPAALTDTRRELAEAFRARASAAHGEAAAAFAAASELLAVDDGLDAQVRAALALLLRG